jgi:hypothetical protein
MEAWPLFSAEIRAIKLTSAALVRLPFGSTTPLSPAVLRPAASLAGQDPRFCGKGRGPSLLFALVDRLDPVPCDLELSQGQSCWPSGSRGL